MVSDNQGGERSQFLDELISLEEAIERLEGAKLITENQQQKIDQLYRRIKQQDGYIQRLNDTLDNLEATMIDIATDLAGAGGMTHKDKDERLLAAIYRLLARGNRPPAKSPSDGRPRDMDDIPF